MNNKFYMICESALTTDVTGIKEKNPNVIEFVTVLQEADVKNRNGRIYPKAVIQRGLDSALVKEHFMKDDFFGEAGHPQDTNVARQTLVDPRNLAFKIKNVWWEGNRLFGKCETLDTAIGRDMAGVIKSGSKVSFSLRAQGSVVRDPARDALIVQDPLMIISFDWVTLPSHQGAYLDKICEETRMAMYGNMLTESCNLYESGSFMPIVDNKVIELPMKDYYSCYYNKYKKLEENYRFNRNDKVVEIGADYVILESTDCRMKVNKQDYLLKSIREDAMGIAPIDYSMFGNKTTEPETTAPDIDSQKVLQTLSSGTDVITESEETTNEVEQNNINESIELDKIEDEDCHECADSSNVVLNQIKQLQHDTGRQLQDVSAGINKDALREEFVRFYNIIAEEYELTNSNDIINKALEYKDLMSENCEVIFRYMKEGK